MSENEPDESQPEWFDRFIKGAVRDRMNRYITSSEFQTVLKQEIENTITQTDGTVDTEFIRKKIQDEVSVTEDEVRTIAESVSEETAKEHIETLLPEEFDTPIELAEQEIQQQVTAELRGRTDNLVVVDYIRETVDEVTQETAQEISQNTVESYFDEHGTEIVAKHVESQLKQEIGEFSEFIESEVQKIVQEFARGLVIDVINDELDNLAVDEPTLRTRARAILLEEADRILPEDTTAHTNEDSRSGMSEPNPSPVVDKHQLTLTVFSEPSSSNERIQEKDIGVDFPYNEDNAPFVVFTTPTGTVVDYEPVEDSKPDIELGDSVSLHDSQYSVTRELREFDQNTDELLYYRYEVAPL